MIKSMSGFGRCEIMEGSRKYTVEMKSVNHRYLDVNIKMPKKLYMFENAIRGELKGFAARGKVDIFITLEDISEANAKVRLIGKHLWKNLTPSVIRAFGCMK